MFCVKCGYQIKDGYKFCPKCGTPVYFEQEKAQSEVKEEKTAYNVKETRMTSTESINQLSEKELFLNPILEYDLNAEEIIEQANNGNEKAIHELAFRYEMGIGVEKNKEKADNLYARVKHYSFDYNNINYSRLILLTDYFFVTKQKREHCLKKVNLHHNSNYLYLLSLDFAVKSFLARRNGKTKDDIDSLKNDYVSNVQLLRDKFPEWLYLNYTTEISELEIENFFKRVKDNASQRFVVDSLVGTHYIPIKIDDFTLEIPFNGIKLRGISQEGVIVCVDYDTNDNKTKCINQFVIQTLLLLPIKKIHLTFVDLKNSYEYEQLLRNLPSSLYNTRPITTEQLMAEFLDSMEKRREEVIKRFVNYPEYCNNNRSIPIPYEIVILYDEFFDDVYNKRLNTLIEWSYRIGVIFILPRKIGSFIYNPNQNDSGSAISRDGTSFFIDYYWWLKDLNIAPFVFTGMNHYSIESNDVQFSSKKKYVCAICGTVYKGETAPSKCPVCKAGSVKFSEQEDKTYKSLIEAAHEQNKIEYGLDRRPELLKLAKTKHIKKPVFRYGLPQNGGIINYTPITRNEILLKACLDYIRTEAETKEEMKVQNLDFDSAAESKYETDSSMMVIPVGKAESKDADFRMDLVSHVHSFIIGQSGSGKSVFLHNIIGGAMLKYAPEDLQLYLLDFKLGGVEFNRYQGAKHVKALLVDNSDPQVTLEILRELRGSMTERGKLLRNAGVNNIGEYNKLHQENRMSHVLVVADECHEMFKADDSIPRQVRNEISDIIIKIAKEGRSQGVHLVFATQTLSGTEISSEIINNVSDFYLLKCAQTDSERLVPNSSAITSELSTGQIYYHHVDEQVKFQAYYTDKEAAEKLMAAIVEKAKDHKSNGEFYFNGAQMFYLDESVKEQMLAVKGKSPVAFMGKAIDISQKDLYIKLNEDFSENVLLLGLNDQEQVTRTTMNLFVSLMMSAKLKHKDIAFKVIDCLNNEEGEVHELIFDLENEGCCEIIERRQRSKFFKELAQSILDGTAEETILLILGQDRFRELKMDMELEESNNSKSNDDDDMMSISDDFFGDSSSSPSSVRTYREALNVILDKGPDYGVHTLLQLEKASNLLFEDYITPKVVFQKFKHLVMLKSDETAGVTLHLNDEIRLEKLSSDWERLRAYYYAEESDSYTLFTPYMSLRSKDIINLLNTL